MKVKRETAWELTMHASTLFTKLWSFGMFTFCVFGLLLVLDDYNDKLFPVIIICSVMIVVSLIVFLFMNKTLGYELDKKSDKAKILYPGALSMKYDSTSFKISELDFIRLKGAVGYSDQTNSTYSALGFDFVLKTGRKVHGGIYSSNQKKIKRIVAQLSKFLDIPVMEKNKRVELLIN